MTMKRPPRRPGQGQKEVLFEYQRLGHIMRIVAIDPETATEVIMIADPRQGMETIKRLAARKLEYVLEKNRAKKRRDTRDNGV